VDEPPGGHGHHDRVRRQKREMTYALRHEIERHGAREDQRGQDELNPASRCFGSREPGDRREEESGDEGVDEPFDLNEGMRAPGIAGGDGEVIQRPDRDAGNADGDAQRKEDAVGFLQRAAGRDLRSMRPTNR